MEVKYLGNAQIIVIIFGEEEVGVFKERKEPFVVELPKVIALQLKKALNGLALE